MENPFRSLFAGPISQTPTNHRPRQTRPNPLRTAFGPPDPIRSSEPLPVCKRRTSSVEAVSETQRSMEKPFRTLFAGPLTQTSTSGHPTQTQPDPPRNVTGCNRPASHSLEAMLETQKPVGKPFHSLFEGPIGQTTLPDPPTQTRPYPRIVEPKQEVPDPTPLTEPSTTHSVLRTLFLRLRPCRQEGEQAIMNSCKDTGGDGLCSSEDEITRGSTSTGQQSQEVEEVDELESEREEPEECVLRDELLVIPLEPFVPYMPLGDPRHHRQADITLPRSTFTQDVVWSFEDLAPLPPPSLNHLSLWPSPLLREHQVLLLDCLALQESGHSLPHRRLQESISFPPGIQVGDRSRWIPQAFTTYQSKRWYRSLDVTLMYNQSDCLDK